MRTDWIADHLPPSGAILDVGFAGEHSEGVHLELRRRCGAARLVGVDLNAPRVRRLALPRTLVGDVFQLPFAAETFDAVVAAEILEHLPEPAGPLREFSRVLRRGGSLLITTPNPYEPSRWLRHWLTAGEVAAPGNVTRFLGNPDHKGFVEPLSFCAALRRSSLNPVTVTTVKFHVPYVGRLLRRPVIAEGRRFPWNRLGAYLCIHAVRV